MAIAETVTLVNRTSKPMTALFDGQSFVLKPGKNHGVPSVVVDYAKAQHPLMGSQDRYEFQGAQFLVGVEEWGDPISPIEQSDAIELLARDTIEDEGKTAVKGPTARVRRSEAIVGLPTDGVAAARQ